MRRTVAAVAVAGLVGTASAQAQEAPAPPASPAGAAEPPAPTVAPSTPAAPPPAAPAPSAPPASPAPAPLPGPPTPAAPGAATGAPDREPASETEAGSASSTTSGRDSRADARRRARRAASERADRTRRRAAKRAAAKARRVAAAAKAADKKRDDASDALDVGGALPAATLGQPIPSLLIERFRIPPFLLSIYQAAGVEYGVRWEILAAINEIETDYGRNLNVSSAGAQGWMQFMPATWRMYGVDANDDGRRDPYNPVDAIFAAGRYLKAAGYARDVRGAIFAYNHADWYVNSVLARAKLVTLLPGELVGSLTGLTEGRFPVAARASYATRVTPRALRRRGERRVLTSQGSSLRSQLDVLADPGAPAVAVQDGEVTRIGTSPTLGRYLQLRDVYGNTYTYANLGSVAKTYHTPRKGATGEEAADPARPAAPEALAAAIPAGLPLRAAGESGPRAPDREPAIIDPDAARRRLIARPGRAASAWELRTLGPSVPAGPRDSELRSNLEAARAAGVAPATAPRRGRRLVVAPRSATAPPASPARDTPRLGNGGAAAGAAKASAGLGAQARAASAGPRTQARTAPGGAAAVRLAAAQQLALKRAVIATPVPPRPLPVSDRPAETPAAPTTNRVAAKPANGWWAPLLPAWAALVRPAPRATAPASRFGIAGNESTPARVARTAIPAPAGTTPAAPAPTATPRPAPTVAPGSADRPGVTVYSPYQRRLLGGLKRSEVRSSRLRVGSAVVGGTVLGRVGKGQKPHLRFRIRPAGKRTPLIDPTPILDGWRLLESSAVYRSTGRSALRADTSSVGRILLESKDRLVRRVLASPDIAVYACGRRDIAAGLVDRRVLATLAFLAAEGLKPTVSSLQCGHGTYTSSGNVSEHTTGTAVDIAAINGVSILGHQGRGSVTEQTIRKLLTLQGTMKPHQIISLLTVPGTDNTLALPDHADHIHVGWAPKPRAAGKRDATTIGGGLRSADWERLMARLNVIENPLVSATPSASALPVSKRKGR